MFSVVGGWNSSCVPISGISIDSCAFSQASVIELLSDSSSHLVNRAIEDVVPSDQCSWQIVKDNYGQKKRQRWPDASGPARQINADGPSIIAVGTIADSPENRSQLLAGALFLANSHGTLSCDGSPLDHSFDVIIIYLDCSSRL